MKVPVEKEVLDRRLLVLAATAVLLDTIFFTLLAPLIPHYRATALAGSAIGILSASYALGSLAFAIPAGFMAVRIGPRRVVIIGLAGLAVTSLIFGVAEDGPLLILARSAQGAAGATVWSGALTWLIEGAPTSRKGEAIGIATGVGIFGALAGPVIGAAAALATPEMVFSLLSTCCLIVCIGAAMTEGPARPDTASRPELRTALRSTSVQRSLFLFTAPAVCFGVLAVSAPLRMVALGGGAALIGIAYTGSAAAEGSLAPFVGRLSDSRGRLLPYMVGLGVCGVAVVGVALAPTSLLLLLGLLAASSGAGFCATPAFALLSDAAADNATHQGVAVSLANLGWSAGQAIGGLAAGVLIESGGETLPLVVSAAILFATLLVTVTNQSRLVSHHASVTCLRCAPQSHG